MGSVRVRVRRGWLSVCIVCAHRLPRHRSAMPAILRRMPMRAGRGRVCRAKPNGNASRRSSRWQGPSLRTAYSNRSLQARWQRPGFMAMCGNRRTAPASPIPGSVWRKRSQPHTVKNSSRINTCCAVDRASLHAPISARTTIIPPRLPNAGSSAASVWPTTLTETVLGAVLRSLSACQNDWLCSGRKLQFSL